MQLVYKIPYRRARAWPSARASKGILHTIMQHNQKRNINPIIGKGVGPGSSVIFANVIGKYWVQFRQYLCRYFNFCQCKFCLKWKKGNRLQ